MPVEPGCNLLHYRIVERLGEGGMGIVWKAVDTTLDREVAIKVLPEAFADQDTRVARFQREAKVLAALNHPNIAAIYGLHQAGEDRFLAMELVAGEELTRRIENGPLPLDEALAIALEIVRALEAAHAAGVVHRDLKPANVMVTPAGKVKVLDFGLAKALAPDSAADGADASLSPTLTAVGSHAGLLLGTAAYMSPEQARGQAADGRADVWALGVVLFEMLSGKRLFTGETVSDVLASVLRSEPDWSLLPAGTPLAVRRLLRRCLAKAPDLRLHHIADARLELQECLEGDVVEESEPATSIAASHRPGPRLLPWLAAVLSLVLAGLALWFGNPFAARESRPVLNLAVPFPSETQLFHEQTGTLALSPTGRHLAVLLVRKGVRQLFLRTLDEPGMAPLSGTENAETPFFSPDGNWVAFTAHGQMKKVSVDGGTPLPVCEVAGNNRGATWTSRDMMIFAPSTATPLYMVPASGGPVTPLTTLDETAGERTHRWPQALPGGDAVLFTVGYLDSSETYEDSPIDVVRISTGERKRVLRGASMARYVAGGHLVFARGGFLFTAPFDLATLEATGPPVPVMEGVMGNRNSGVVHMDVSATGLLAFIPGQQTDVRRVLTWVYPDGTGEELSAEADAYSNARLSPDGRRVVYTLLGSQSQDVWTFDIGKDIATRLTFEGNNIDPIWSPDGEWVAFTTDRTGRLSAFRKRSDGSGAAEPLLDDTAPTFLPRSWSPDGRHLAADGGPADADIWILSPEDGKSTEFLATEHDEGLPAFSPDGRWIAYQSNESGSFEIYVRPFPGPGGKWQVSADGGTEPVWSRDGSRLFFWRESQIWVVDVESGAPQFRAGRPRIVVDQVEQLFAKVNYSVDGNGERFLVLARDSEKASDPDRVAVIVNWPERLRVRD